MKFLAPILIAISLVGCAKIVKDVEQPEQALIEADEFLVYYESMVEEAQELQAANGWIGDDCDGMAWNGFYASAYMVTGVDIEAAEFIDEPGRFGRRPAPHCWLPDKTADYKQESRSTWSRDMAVAGFIPWAFLTDKRDVLERHVEYGKSKNWVMGSPMSNEVLYSPSVQGLLHYAIYAMGGENNPNRLWPGTYTSGLTDYQAHLQMKSIWLRGEIQKKLNEFKLNDPVISQLMLDRIIEHRNRVPEDPFYQFVWGLYHGDMQPAMNAILKGTVGGYVRCDSGNCKLQHRIGTASLILKALGKFNG